MYDIFESGENNIFLHEVASILEPLAQGLSDLTIQVNRVGAREKMGL